MRNTLMAGASSFAHLLGRAPKATKVEEEEDKKKSRRAESEEDGENGDGEEEDSDTKDRKGKKARAEDTERDEEEDETKERDEEEGDDAKKGKKAKGKRAEADDEDDDEEGDDGSDGADMRKKGARTARLRERARCAAIFADASAGKNPALAASLAFGTDLPRTQAISVLRAGGLAVASAPRRPSLDERMASVKTPVVGASAPAPDTSLAAQIVAAGRKRRGEI